MTASLATYTTLGLGGPAARLVTATSKAQLVELVRDADAAREPLLVLGDGSNVVVGDAGFPGLVVLARSLGIEWREGPSAVEVEVAAGERWHDFAMQTVERGLRGVEALVGIPGRVGAAPLQNIGAYGQEVSDTVTHVGVYDRVTLAERLFTREECGFGYRNSVFRGVSRWVVTSVRFRFERAVAGLSSPVRYAELARALGVSVGERVDLARVPETVLALRRGKGMLLEAAEPRVRSAGSFFVNPVVDEPTRQRVEARARELALLAPEARLPSFSADDGHKLPAAWLIERAGFPRGTHRGTVGVSEQHALALVCRSPQATTRELLALAHEIRAAVRTRFGVDLELEPICVNC